MTLQNAATTFYKSINAYGMKLSVWRRCFKPQGTIEKRRGSEKIERDESGEIHQTRVKKLGTEVYVAKDVFQSMSLYVP